MLNPPATIGPKAFRARPRRKVPALAHGKKAAHPDTLSTMKLPPMPQEASCLQPMTPPLQGLRQHPWRQFPERQFPERQLDSSRANRSMVSRSRVNRRKKVNRRSQVTQAALRWQRLLFCHQPHPIHPHQLHSHQLHPLRSLRKERLSPALPGRTSRPALAGYPAK